MTIDQDKEDLDRAIELLQEALGKLQEDYYGGWAVLEDEIDKFLKEIKDGRNSNIESRGK